MYQLYKVIGLPKFQTKKFDVIVSNPPYIDMNLILHLKDEGLTL